MRRYVRLGLPVLAFAVLVLLMVAPATGWLVRSQFAMGLPLARSLAWVRHAGGDNEEDAGALAAEREAVEAAAGRRPDDFAVQLAAALMLREPDVSRVESVRALEGRFDGDPSFHAAVLRLSLLGPVRIQRTERFLLTGQPVPPGPRPPPDPGALAAFDRAAARGERADPDNAFFPFLRAVGFFAARRDADALAALRRAAARPGWREYISDEATGGARLMAEAFGDRSAVTAAQVGGRLLLPHYAGLREATRIATYKAVLAERAGRPHEGAAIRRDLARLGSKMRIRSSLYIGSLVGAAITDIATAGPGRVGGKPGPVDLGDDEESTRRMQRAYLVHLHRIGRAEEAAWVEAEHRAVERMRFVGKRGMHRAPFGGGPERRLALWWAAGLTTLAGAAWVLLLGAGSALVGRLRLRTGTTRDDALYVLCMFALAAALVTPAAALLFLEVRSVNDFLLAAQASGDPGGANGEGQRSAPGLLLAAAAGAFAGPVLAFAAARVGVRGRSAAVAGIFDGLRGAALLVASLLIFLYGAVALETSRQEHRLSTDLQRVWQHEGRYLADVAGEPWPD